MELKPNAVTSVWWLMVWSVVVLVLAVLPYAVLLGAAVMHWCQARRCRRDYGAVLLGLAVLCLPPDLSAAPPPCTPITILDTTIELRWSAPTPPPETTVTGFILSRKVDKGVWDTYATIPRDARTFTDTGLQVGKTYYYTLQTRARLNDGRVVLSDHSLHGMPGMADPCVTVADAPTNLTAAATCAARTMRLTWGSTAPTRSVRIEQRPATGTTYKLLVTTNGRVYHDEGVKEATCYRWRYTNQQAWTADVCASP